MNNVAPTAQVSRWTMILRCPESFTGRLGRILLYCFLSTVVLIATLSYLTYQLSGPDGIVAMFLALAISMISNVAGSIPACTQIGTRNNKNGLSIMATGMILRLIILILLAVPLILGKIVSFQPFLIWLAGAYNVHLLIESWFMMSWLNQPESRS